MRVRQGGDSSAGIWFYQDKPKADRAFVGMRTDDEAGFWGNVAGNWGLWMNVASLGVTMAGDVAMSGDVTMSGRVTMGGDFGAPGASTMSLFGSRIGDTGGGVLFIRSGGPVISMESNVGINNRNPQTPLDVSGPSIAITGRGGSGIFQAGVHGLGNIGVWAEGSNDGVFATGPNFAGVFWGRVQITGELTKGGGGFRIDHPLDPREKYLSHSFVESPERLNVYVGVVETDDEGRATVQLPDFFETLNRDYTYQLTPIGGPGSVAVAEPVRDNAFTIQAEQPRAAVSWQVTGVRQDAWAAANPLIVEEDKPDDERDLFLHPEVHGEPETRHVFAAMRKAGQAPHEYPDNTDDRQE
jgi:hypothetical protein